MSVRTEPGAGVDARRRHAAFWRAWPSELPEDARTTLDARIAEKLAEASAAPPDFGITADRLLAHWAAHLDPSAPLAEQVERTHLADLRLALACAEGSAAAQEELRTRFLPRIVPAVQRLDPTRAFLEEVQQRVLERLLVAEPGRGPRIADFAGQSSLLHWLRAVSVRLALNLRRDGRRHPELPAGDALVEVAAPMRDPQLELLKQGFGPEFSRALSEGLEALDRRERALLRLCYVEGLSLSQIGAVYQVNKSTVSRWLADARSALLEWLRGALQGRLQVPAPELDSLMRALKSQVELNLSSVLRSRID